MGEEWGGVGKERGVRGPFTVSVGIRGCGTDLLGSAIVSGGPLEDPWVICNEENASASLCLENM